ncbi:MAG: hypothetical protein FWD55_05420, partial [Propionibacteriaceae bacterium]|nr:hypothetical protein [Propionibacteriaceae bacterium]
SDVVGLVAQARAKAAIWDGSSYSVEDNLAELTFPGDEIVFAVQLPGIPARYGVGFDVIHPDGSVTGLTGMTDSSGKASMTYVTPLTQQGIYEVNWSIANVSPRYPMAFKGGGKKPQMLFFGIPTPRGLSGAASVELVFSPAVGTQASAAILEAGDVLTDTVSVTGLSPNLAWTLSGHLRGPILAVDGECESLVWSDADDVILPFTYEISDSEIDAEGTAVISGLGPWEVPETLVDQCVSYEEVLVGKDATGAIIVKARHKVGSPHQTALLPAIVVDIVPLTEEIETPIVINTGGRAVPSADWVLILAMGLILLGLIITSVPRSTPVILPPGRTPGSQSKDQTEDYLTIVPTLAAGDTAYGSMTGGPI